MYKQISWLLAFMLTGFAAAQAYAQSAKTLVEQAAQAMGGMAALRAVKNQLIESEGKQFDSSSTPKPLGPTRQISTFRYTLTRVLAQPKLRLQWESRNTVRGQVVRFVEVIDGEIGSLLEGEPNAAKQTRLHAGRLATRLREEKRAPASLLIRAAGQPTLRRLADAEVNGVRHPVVSFKDAADEFHIYFDPKSRLPAQVDLLDYDPLEGDSSFLLKYADWRKIGGLLHPFSLRYELNGKPLQEEQIGSIQNNIAFVADPFAIPEAVRSQKSDARRSRRNGFCAVSLAA